MSSKYGKYSHEMLSLVMAHQKTFTCHILYFLPMPPAGLPSQILQDFIKKITLNNPKLYFYTKKEQKLLRIIRHSTPYIPYPPE